MESSHTPTQQTLRGSLLKLSRLCDDDESTQAAYLKRHYHANKHSGTQKFLPMGVSVAVQYEEGAPDALYNDGA